MKTDLVVSSRGPESLSEMKVRMGEDWKEVVSEKSDAKLSFLVSKPESTSSLEKSWRSDKNIRKPTDYDHNEEIQVLQDELRYMKKRNAQLRPGPKLGRLQRKLELE